jgi:hypothetical protein
MRTLAIAVLAAATSGCGILYTNIRVPRSYRTATAGDVKTSPNDPVVESEVCGQSVLYLFLWGDFGYAAAANRALERRPNSILYDAKFDMRVDSFLLGLYTKTCTKLTGRAASL